MDNLIVVYCDEGDTKKMILDIIKNTEFRIPDNDIDPYINKIDIANKIVSPFDYTTEKKLYKYLRKFDPNLECDSINDFRDLYINDLILGRRIIYELPDDIELLMNLLSGNNKKINFVDFKLILD